MLRYVSNIDTLTGKLYTYTKWRVVLSSMLGVLHDECAKYRSILLCYDTDLVAEYRLSESIEHIDYILVHT